MSQKNILKSEINFHHLVRAIVSDSHIFVTRDSRLLNIANEFYEYFKLSVIRPDNLIVQFNEFTRNPKYQPTRLSGSSLEQVAIKKGEEEAITNYFYCHEQNETKAQFQQKLRRFLTNPENFTCFKVVDAENKALALIVYGKHNDYELEIPIIRVADSPLSTTLAQHLIFKSILHSAGENRQSTIINDCFLQEQVNQAIQEYQFIQVNDNFIRLNLAVVETADKLSKRLKKIASNPEKQYRFFIQLAKSIKHQIPENVRIIGTMNTADRSIAEFDYALRRRFAFIQLRSNYEILNKIYQDTNFPIDKLINILQKINQVINDKNYEIGISFFITDNLFEDIEDIWCMEIEPYLEEYFFNQPEAVEEFRWNKLQLL